VTSECIDIIVANTEDKAVRESQYLLMGYILYQLIEKIIYVFFVFIFFINMSITNHIWNIEELLTH